MKDPFLPAKRPRPRIRADVYPAVLVVAPPDPDEEFPTASSLVRTPPSHRMLDKVRVIVTLDQVLVFQDSASGPALIFSERLQDYTPPPKRASTLRASYIPREATLITDSGKTLAFHRATGCGCGSRLKSFDPFGANTSYSISASSDL